MKQTLIGTLTAALLVSACSTVPDLKGSNGSGTILGGASGTYIGSQYSDTGAVAGGLAGAYIGYNILSLFSQKREYAKEAFQKAAEYNHMGQTANWHDPYKWEYGSYTPYDTVQTNNGVYCRQILETVKISQQLFSNMVTACRNKDGQWIPE